MITTALSLSLSLAAQDFKEDYYRFYQKIAETNTYRMEGSVEVYDPAGERVLTQAVELRKHGNNYFMRVGEDETIYGEHMLISMDKDFRSIVLSERSADTANPVFSKNEFFSLLEESHGNKKVETAYVAEGDYYVLHIPGNLINKVEIYFKAGVVEKIISHYFENKNTSKTVFTLTYDWEYLPDPEDFSIERYTRILNGEYTLKPAYANFELSLN